MIRTSSNNALWSHRFRKLLAFAFTPACLGTVHDPREGTVGGAQPGGEQQAMADSGAGDGDQPDANPGEMPGMAFPEAGLPAPDAGGPPVIPSGSVAMMVAVGRGGRTTISCDAGRTWIQNQIETSATARCWGQPNDAIPQIVGGKPNPDWIECDHHTGSSTGLVYHDGWFIKSIGWGTDGRTLRSYNGVTWSEPVPSWKDTYLGLVVLGDRLVAMGTPQPRISTDNGLSWSLAKELGWDAGHVRQATASGYGGGSIVFITDTGLWSSRDGAKSYQGPSALPCQGSWYGLASSPTVTVLTSDNGSVCTTLDGGQSWKQHAVAGSLFTNPVWNGKTFAVWGEDKSGTASAFFSTDGASWTSKAMSPRVAMATVGTHVSGSFVATNDVWNEGYEKQKFFRSDDGVAWETLPSSAFTPSHPISHFVSGVVPANAYCPAP